MERRIYAATWRGKLASTTPNCTTTVEVKFAGAFRLLKFPASILWEHVDPRKHIEPAAGVERPEREERAPARFKLDSQPEAWQNGIQVSGSKLQEVVCS